MDRGARQAHHEHGAERSQERQRWDRERTAATADAAEVDEGEQEQHPERQGQRVGQEFGHGRGDRADSRGDAHGDGEHVVETQCGGRDEGARASEILLRHRVRAAPVGVCGDGLAVRQRDRRQDGDDDQSQGHDVAQTRVSERSEDGEQRLGAVRSGGECIEAEQRNPSQETDSLARLVLGPQRSPEQDVDDMQGPLLGRPALPGVDQREAVGRRTSDRRSARAPRASRAPGPRRVARRARGQDFCADPLGPGGALLTSIFLGCTSGFFATVISRTPPSRDARRLSPSAPSGSVKLREKVP